MIVYLSKCRAVCAFTNLWQKNRRLTTGRWVFRCSIYVKTEQHEKYGHVAFDSSQKAVLTSCVLRYKPIPALSTSQSAKDDGQGMTKEEGLVNCCFSFTIRRDRYGIPSMIVGNFIRC
jgi:hypothetical protein